MKIIKPSFTVLYMADGAEILRLTEICARNCYQSEPTGDTEGFIRRIIKSGHESVLEHSSATVRIICDRGVMAEITRHRHHSFSIKSTRYCNYSKEKFGGEITVIHPYFWEEGSKPFLEWNRAMMACERAYLNLIDGGASPEEARSVLPNSLETNIICTANMRSWRHWFKLRCSKKSHPQMRQVALPILAEFHRRLPVVFEDIYSKYEEEIK